MSDDTKRGLYRKFYVQRLAPEDMGPDVIGLHLSAIELHPNQPKALACGCREAGCPHTPMARTRTRIAHPPPKHGACHYYVLDLDHDRFAGPALRAYADACALDFPELAKDIRLMLPLAIEESSAPRSPSSGDAGKGDGTT